MAISPSHSVIQSFTNSFNLSRCHLPKKKKGCIKYAAFLFDDSKYYFFLSKSTTIGEAIQREE
jgi:hypothetical protein